MPTIVERDVQVALLTAEFAAISAMCRDFDEASWSTPTCLPGWTVKDQLSHLAGTEQMLAGEPPPAVSRTRRPVLKNDLARANEVWVEASRSLPGAEVLALFDAVAGGTPARGARAHDTAGLRRGVLDACGP